MAFYLPPSTSYYAPSRPPSAASLPRRSDSMTRSPIPQRDLFMDVEDDLRDARRVHSHGQEEDLRFALNKLITRVGEMSSLLKSAYAKQKEVETSLTLAQSNLKMAQANNEMLEDALKRDPSVGWRRAISVPDAGSARPSIDSPTFAHHPSPLRDADGMPSPVSPSSAPKEKEKEREGSSFFSFGRSRNSSPPIVAPAGGVLAHRTNSLSSASMPSLVASETAALVKEMEELKKKLESEQTANKKAREDKSALEAELESLSQALFEEANKMVASERIRAAEFKEELIEAKRQKDALTSALLVIETENHELRSNAGTPVPPSRLPSSLSAAGFDDTDAPRRSLDYTPSHSRAASTASNTAIKSPGLAAPRPPRSPLRRSASLSGGSTGGSRPGSPSPLVSSPLASRAPTTRASTPDESAPPALTAEPESILPASDDLTRRFAPALTFEGPTPPAGPPRSPPALSGGRNPAARRPGGLSRSHSLSLPARAELDFEDPNLPTGADEYGDAGAPLFRRPTLPTLASLGQSLPTLAGLRAAAASLPSSPAALAKLEMPRWPLAQDPLVAGPSAIAAASSPPTHVRSSPKTSPQARTSPIPIARAPSESEGNPWSSASPIDRVRPALSRMSSVGSLAGQRLSAGLDALAGFAAGFDDADLQMKDGGAQAAHAPRRMGSWEAAAFGGR